MSTLRNYLKHQDNRLDLQAVITVHNQQLVISLTELLSTKIRSLTLTLFQHIVLRHQ